MRCAIVRVANSNKLHIAQRRNKVLARYTLCDRVILCKVKKQSAFRVQDDCRTCVQQQEKLAEIQ